MDLSEDTLDALFAAGGAAVAFNAPLGGARADGFCHRLPELSARSLVDLGCGRGELARRFAGRLADLSVLGIDNNRQLVREANRLAAEAGLDSRVRFEEGDAATWTPPPGETPSIDGVVCIGASHVFGGSSEMFQRLADLIPNGVAIVGDGVWDSAPDTWCQETFGDMPAGLDALVAVAEGAGWTVVDRARSTLAEWDEFELGWIGGVRAVGTNEAEVFADARQAEYERYRGVLGFGWLVLSR